MSVPGLYEPSAVQLEAHSFQPYDEVEILYGGTAFCGKTLWLRWDPIETQWAGEHQRWLEARARGESFESVGWALHVRRTYPMLLQTILYMRAAAKKLDPGVAWDGDAKMLTFSCGYRMQYGHVQNAEDWRNYDSMEYTHLSVDESIQTLKQQYDGLWSRVRTTDPVLRHKLRTCMASNPDAPFEGLWVKERFVDPAPAGRKVLVENTTLEDGTVKTSARIYIPARLSDNPNKAACQTYEAKLRKLPRHIMMARLFGNWNTVQGAFFESEFIPDVHIVKPYAIPPHWPIYRAMDWGYKVACVVKYFAVDEEGNIIVIDELTWNHKCEDHERKDAELVAIAIKKYEKAHDAMQEILDAERGDGLKSPRYWNRNGNYSNLSGPADYQIREERGNKGPTIEETFAGYGIYWQACKKNRYMATAELLRRLKDIPKSPQSRPGITWFDTCVHTARTIPTLKRHSLTDERNKNQEVPMDGGDDHWFDVDCYICLFRASPAEKNMKNGQNGSAPTWDDDEDELAGARMKKQTPSRWGYGI